MKQLVKAWGRSCELAGDDRMQIVRIEVQGGGFCSRHHHRFKSNTFQVLEGCLRVAIYEANGTREFELTPDGQPLTVPAGVEHRFWGLAERSVALETYTAVDGQPIDGDDIVRRDVGGCGEFGRDEIVPQAPAAGIGANGLPQLTTVVALDERHLEEFRIVWPSWRQFRSELVEWPLLLVCDGRDSLAVWQRRLAFLAHPNMKIVLWDMPGMGQRDKMLSGLVLAAAEHVETPWHLKLDTDTAAVADADWLQRSWFAPNGEGQLPAFIASPWGYTKPADAIARLDDWGDGIPPINARPRLNLQPTPGARLVKHRRITSWCFFGRTDWTRRMASYCDGRLPVPSHDTFLWYCAARSGQFYRRIRMKRFGWVHARPRRLRRQVAKALSRVEKQSSAAAAGHDEAVPMACAPGVHPLPQLLANKLGEPQAGAEVGVFRGETSAHLLQHFAGLTLSMVDSWDSYAAEHPYRRSGDRCGRFTAEQQAANRREAESRTAFAAARRRVVPLESSDAAREVAAGSLDFVFIDADHTFAAVQCDLEVWWPKVRSGGLLCGHDYNHPRDRRGLWGVRQAVDEFAKATGLPVELGEGTIWWIVRP